MRLLSRWTRPRHEQERATLPPRCLGIAAALQDEEGCVVEAVRAAAHEYAEGIEELDAFLSDLDLTVRTVSGQGPSAELVRAGAVAWADRLERDFNCLTCEDPLTGLHSIHHVQSLVEQLYGAGSWCGWPAGEAAGEAAAEQGYVVVVVDLQPAGAARLAGSGLALFEHKLRLAAAREVIGEHLAQEAHPAALSPTRAVVVARRTPPLAERVMALRLELDARLGLSPSRGRCRVWIEALPPTLTGARQLVDELAR